MHYAAQVSSRCPQSDLVFCNTDGEPMDATSARWQFRTALQLVPSLNATDWAPRELRHSFVSILSAKKVPIEEISKLVGHSSINIPESVYRKQIQTIVETGTTAMDDIFSEREPRSPADREADGIDEETSDKQE